MITFNSEKNHRIPFIKLNQLNLKTKQNSRYLQVEQNSTDYSKNDQNTEIEFQIMSTVSPRLSGPQLPQSSQYRD